MTDTARTIIGSALVDHAGLDHITATGVAQVIETNLERANLLAESTPAQPNWTPELVDAISVLYAGGNGVIDRTEARKILGIN